ncbi:MAG: hypothetical protein RR420_05320 [Anaerovoracaceae bacterium]
MITIELIYKNGVTDKHMINFKDKELEKEGMERIDIFCAKKKILKYETDNGILYIDFNEVCSLKLTQY